MREVLSARLGFTRGRRKVVARGLVSFLGVGIFAVASLSISIDADQVLNSLPVPTTCPTQILFGLIPKAHFTKNYPVKMLYRVCARSFDYCPRQALDSLSCGLWVTVFVDHYRSNL